MVMRRAGLVLAGLVLGLVVSALLLGLYFRLAQVEQIRTAIAARLRLPAEVMVVERLGPSGAVRIRLRDVALLDEAGDTLVAAPVARLWFDPATLSEDGPIELTDVELRRPYARLLQAPDGTWNIAGAMRVTAGGQEVRGPDDERPVLLRDVRIVDGRALVAIPATPADSGTFAARLNLPRVRLGRQLYQAYAFGELNATLPEVRVGGGAGWRVEVASLATRLAEPELRIAQLRGVAEAVGEDGVRFSVSTLRVGGSQLAGRGTLRFTDSGTRMDVGVQAQPLLFADLRTLLPSLPEEGSATFQLQAQSREGGRTALLVSDLQMLALDSRVTGQLGVVLGGDGPVGFQDTRLELAPLRLTALEQLGLVTELPVQGEVRGTVATTGEGATVQQGALQLALTATLVPRGEQDLPPSVITADGAISFGGEPSGLRLDGVRLQLQPLYLGLLAGMLPEQREQLRGEVRGVVQLGGTPRALTVDDGELVYQVGSAPNTRLADLSGALTLDPALSYSLRATAQPLALATLTELFPALPFRNATLAGPLRVEGDANEVRYSADLAGGAGAVRFAGSATFGTPLRFAVEGRVQTFAPSAILRGELPVEGAFTGTFAARGTTQDLAFNVDLEQTAGRFAMQGRVRDGNPRRFEVDGNMTDFRVGALIGQPGLFASPLTGRFQVASAPEGAYRFDVDLRGDAGLFNLAGSYRPGTVPVYEARGSVAGLNVRRLPFGQSLPRTNLTARVDLNGQGTTLETLAGTLSLDARGSTVGGLPLDVGRARLEVRDGILVVDTLLVQLRNARLAADGMWGLTRPAPRPLNFQLNAPDLSVLGRALATPRQVQPQLAGSLQAEGTVSGSIRYPNLAVGLRGRRLRYEAWQAGSLALTLHATRNPSAGWGGEASVMADNLVLANGQTLQAVRLEANGDQGAVAMGLFARRAADSEIAASGTLLFTQGSPSGLALEALDVRAEDTAWRLVGPTRLQWAGVDGMIVQNLQLERTGGDGRIVMDGRVPPTGEASLRVQAQAVDMGDVRRLVGRAAPDIQGRLTLDATLEGPVGDPDLMVQARIDSLRYQGAAADLITLRADYIGQRLESTAEVWIGGRSVATAQAGVPMLLSLEGLLPSFELRRASPLSAEIRADSLPVQLVTALAPTLSEGAGVATASVTVRGTLDVPELSGWAAVQQGAVRVIPLGVRYTDIRGRLTLAGNTVRIDTLTARSGGTLALDGTVRFEPGGGPLVQVVADMSTFRVMDVRDQATVSTSGRVALSGAFPNPVLTGRLELEESTFTIPDLAEQPAVEITDVEVGQIGADTATAGGPLPPFLAGLRIEGLQVFIGESVWLVSDQARIQIAGELRLFRTGEELRVFGGLQAVRGRYALEIGSLVREFDIVSGRVQFFGTGELNPSLDIVAANRVRTGGAGAGDELTVLVNIGGTLQAPRIQLSSDTPTPLSESELFSLLIFGQPSFALGGLGTQRFAEQLLVQELVGGILASELERPILASGLCDYVRVQSGITTLSNLLPTDPGSLFSTLNAAAIECGKEISDQLFLTVETGIGALLGEPAAASWGIGLEWQINRELLADLSYGPVRRGTLLRLVTPTTRYQLSTELRRRWEYGRPRARSPLDLPGDGLPGEPAPARPRPEDQPAPAPNDPER